MKKLTTGKMWIFAVGQLGWSLLSALITNWLVYFYQPEQASIDAGQTLFIPQGLVILGIATIIGGIAALGRVFDAFTDPWIANLSDRCKSPRGRRIPFMQAVAVPFALVTVLVFFSPINGVSTVNAFFLLVMLLLFYLCMTIYCTPFNALIPELGRTQEARVNISTYISLTFFAGTAIAYAAPNPGESGTSFIFDGCCAIAAGGEILASACMEAEPFVCADVDAGTLAPFEPFFRPAAQTSYLPEDETLARADCERILDLQAAALARRAAHIGSKGFVIGVSGGLDSALALLAAVAAAEKLHMPASEVVGISMPGFGSSRRTRGNAKALVEALGCTYREIDITASCRQHFQDIGQDENDHNVVFENAQARERTQILLDISNKEGLLDVGTGDLSEAALGWTTFGGDHLAQYGVNASIPKTVMRRVVAVAKERFAQAAPVLQDILDTPVSPELLPGQNGEIAQKTEELIGSYTLHDLFIYEMVVNHRSPKALYEAALEKTDFPEAEVYRVLGIFLKRFFAQQFKRVCAPEAPLILLSIAPSCFPFPSDMRAGVFWEEYESIKNG